MLTNMLWMLAFGLLFAGLSLALMRLVWRQDAPNPLAAFWLGWAAALGFLQVWHLFWPVGLAALLLLAAGGLAGWLLSIPQLRDSLRALPPAQAWLSLAAGAALLGLIAHRGMFAELHYDHGLYHLQTVRWMQEYRIVPGLGNLHHRLAFNNASMLYAAVLNGGQVGGPAFNVASLLLMWALALRGGLAAVGLLLGRPGSGSLSQVFYALSLPAALYYLAYGTLAGYSPDVPVFALQVEIIGRLLGAFQPAETPDQALPARLGQVALLAAAGVIVKLSMAVFSLLALLAAAWIWARRRGWQLRRDLPLLRAGAGILAALILPWLYRGVLLSGYPLYPSALLGLPVAWRIPVDMVAPLAPGIRSWALGLQHLPPGAGFIEWLVYWQSRVPLPLKLGGLLALVLLAASALRLWPLRRRLDANLASLLAALAISLAGLLYWLAAAPDPRFSGALVWITLICALLLFARLYLPDLAPAESRPARLAVLALLFLALLLVAPRYARRTPPGWWLRAPGEIQMAREYLPEGAWHVETTRSGLQVTIPEDYNNESCWDAPLPCTRANDLHPRLALFRPPDLGSGFYLIPDE